MLKWYVKDAPVSRKIQLGFGLLVALVGGGAGFSAFTVQQTEAEVGVYRESAKANVAAEQAVGEFTQMRVAARDYADALAAGDSAGAARHMQELRHLRDQVLEEFTKLSEAIEDETVRSQIASLPEQVELYESLTEDGSPDALRRRGELAESLTSDINELAEVLTARRDEIGPVMQGRLDQMAIVAIGLLVMTLGLGGVLAVVLSNIIGRPIKSTTEAMNKLAAGDLTINTDGGDRKDDVGGLLRSLETFRSNAEAKIELDKKNIEAAGYVAAISRVQAVIEFSLDGKILTANENFCSALGYTLDEIRGQHHSMFVDHNYRQSPDYRMFWDKLGRGVADEGKYLRMAKGGRVIWIQATYNPIMDASGKPYKVVKFATDITEAELAAQEQEALLGSIGKSQAVISFKPDGTILDANDNFLAALGYSKQEIVGKHHSMFVDAEFRASGDYRAFWDQLTRGDFSAGKFKRIARGGKEIWIQASYNPLVNRQGQVFKVVKYAVDITAAELQLMANEKERQTKAAEQNTVVTSLASGLKQLAEGNLIQRITTQFAPDYEQLRADFNDAMGTIQDAMKAIVSNAGGIRTGAGEISQAADDLSRRTEQQAASLEETAAALDEITATVKKTADGSKQANSVVATTRADAEASGQVVKETVAAMAEIEKSSKQISQIISVIDEIAFQTNLLALNAGVEAARAGEAGRGFAVVASEVRALAQRSSSAAKEIKDLISASSQHVETGVELVGDAGKALQGIVNKVSEISALVGEIAASAQEQSTALVEVNTAINQMDQVTQQNAAMVEESTAASHSLRQEADALMALISRFKTGASAGGEQHAPRAKGQPVAQQRERVAKFAAGGGGGGGAAAKDDSWQEF